MVLLFELVLCISNHVALHRGLAVDSAECIEFEYVGFHAAGALYAPCQTEVGGEDSVSCFALDHCVDSSGVLSSSITYYAVVALHALYLCQLAEQGVLVGYALGALGLSVGSLCCVGSSGVSIIAGKTLVEGSE